jgi:hypothetical protein
MKLILDTLERARLAASPSDAMDMADAIADLHALADALSREGRTLDDVVPALDALDAIQNHVEVQPFDTSDDEPLVTELTPGAFAEWLGELERLAQ